MKEVKSGSYILAKDRSGKEHLFSIGMMKGDIAIFNKNGSYAMGRVLRADDTFTLWNVDYKYVSA